MTNEIKKEIKAAVSVLSEGVREVVEKAVVASIENGGFSIKLTAFNSAVEYLVSVNEGGLVDNYEKTYGGTEGAISLLGYFLELEITGIVVTIENGEILAGYDPSPFGLSPLAEFIEDNREIFEAYNDDVTRAIYYEILAFYGE